MLLFDVHCLSLDQYLGQVVAAGSRDKLCQAISMMWGGYIVFGI